MQMSFEAFALNGKEMEDCGDQIRLNGLSELISTRYHRSSGEVVVAAFALPLVNSG